MIWLNPWAWFGLLALGVPVLIHLLARRSARVQRFPTLRFLDAPRVLPRRRTRLSDLPLLAVRLGILAAAVTALAQPLLLISGRNISAGSRLARAIVVDTSASMMRRMPSGLPALDTARAEAQRLARDAQTSVILETAAPGNALAGAAAWLDVQPASREIVIVSDFQLGGFAATDLEIVPQRTGVRLTRIERSRTADPIEAVTRNGALETSARITLAEDRTSVAWTTRPFVQQDGSSVLLLAGAQERAEAEAARTAAFALGLPLTTDTATRIAIIFPAYEHRAALLRDAQALNEPWMGDVVARLHRDSLLMTATASTELRATIASDSARFSVIAQTNSGQPAVLAARGRMRDRDGLLLFSLADAGTLASAALIAATVRANSDSPPVAELEPASLDSETLAALQRPPTSEPAPGAMNSGDASDGRWLWLLVLLLLGIETWLRQPQHQPVAETGEVVHERVA